MGFLDKVKKALQKARPVQVDLVENKIFTQPSVVGKNWERQEIEVPKIYGFRTVPSPEDVPLPEDLEVKTVHDGIQEAIRTEAYYAWEKAGKPEGRNDEFWFEAEMKYFCSDSNGI